VGIAALTRVLRTRDEFDLKRVYQSLPAEAMHTVGRTFHHHGSNSAVRDARVIDAAGVRARVRLSWLTKMHHSVPDREIDGPVFLVDLPIDLANRRYEVTRVSNACFPSLPMAKDSRTATGRFLIDDEQRQSGPVANSNQRTRVE
jgi:hypothetical protein